MDGQFGGDGIGTVVLYK